MKSLEQVENTNHLSEKSIKTSLERIVKDCKDNGKFDLRNYEVLVEFIPYIHLISPKKREMLMKSLSGQVLERLDNFGNDEEDLPPMEEKYIPSLFELRSVIVAIWSEGYEAQYVIKSVDRMIAKVLQFYDKNKFEYINLFFRNLEYPYTKENLKKCKMKIIKENHPDNGGSGEYIQIVQSIYKAFLNYIS